MIAKIIWQGTWTPPQMTDNERRQFVIVIKHLGIGTVASKLLPFPWPMIVSFLGVAVISGLLAWPIGNYGDNNNIPIAHEVAVGLGMLSACLVLSIAMVCSKHILNITKVRSWLKTMIKAYLPS